MNKIIKLSLGIIAIVALIGGSTFAYKELKSRYGNENQLSVEEKGEIEASQEDITLEDTTPEDTTPEDTMPEEITPDEEEKKNVAPNFTVYDMEGNSITLESKFGKPIVLNFWASWCGPCKSEMPDFQKVYNEIGTDIEFMMVNLTDGSRETKEKALEFVKEYDYTFPIYLDLDQEAAYVYSISSIPTTIFIDKDGNVVTYAQGAIDEETLLRGIEMIKGE